MPWLEDKPTWTVADAETVVREEFGLVGEAAALPSERDQNFRIVTQTGARYVLKVANARDEPAYLRAENGALAATVGSGLTPRVVPTSSGETLLESGVGGGAGHSIRLVSFLPGTPLGNVKRHSSGLLRDLGAAAARLDRALMTFDDPAIHRELHWDLARGAEVAAARVELIGDERARGWVSRTLEYHAAHVEGRLGGLRQAAIHNDLNDFNVLVTTGAFPEREQRVSGIVDFGDLVYSRLVNELAIALAYAVLGKSDPLRAACAVVGGYHRELALTEDEVRVLYPLLCLRLAVSVAMAAEQGAEQPDEPYLGVSQGPIAEVLPRLEAIHPRLTECAFREACGWETVPGRGRVLATLGERKVPLGELVVIPKAAPVHWLDVGVGSPLVEAGAGAESPDVRGRRVVSWLVEQTGSVDAVGVGGYDEARVFYGRLAPDEASGGGRTVHLGIDVCAPEGAEVRLPLDGVVAGREDANRPGDYGPVVLVRHDVAGEALWTLYGHLSRTSLAPLEVGKRLKKGDLLGTIGSRAENGGWWPHLHFQVLLDNLDIACNFPGVATASAREIWLALCPDPGVLVDYPKRPEAPAVREARERHAGRNLGLSYAEPLHVARGWKQYLFDVRGRRYLDVYNNVAHVGHSHPRVARAAAEQFQVLNTNTRYLQDAYAAYTSRLTALFPDGLDCCFLVASGSEANELAVRLARAHTRRRDTIVLESAYHGHSTTMIDLSPYKHDGPGGDGAPDWVHTAPVADVYRGKYRAEDRDAARNYADEVRALAGRLKAEGRPVGAFLAETAPSVGGQIFLPDGYLSAVYDVVHAHGGICIADEVQTGFGRLGTSMWGFEEHAVVPDIVVLGKPIGNGFPMGAVITTRAIADSFANGMEFFSTFGGSTAACAVGLAVLNVLEEEGLQENALRVGRRLLDGFEDLQDEYHVIGDVRGSGLFLGVELVRDRETREPAGAEAGFVANRFKEKGVLLGTDGPDHNVIKLRGPMCLTEADADRVVTVFGEILAEEFAGA